MKRKYKVRYDRIIAVLIIIIIPVVILLMSTGKNADSTRENATVESVPDKVQTTSSTAYIAAVTDSVSSTQPAAVPHIDYPDCRSAAFYSVDDKQLLYSDSSSVKTAPASLTKLLTASVALKYVDKNKIFAVGSEQWLVQPYSSLCYIQIGNMLSLEDLITGMLMASGNDAAYTVAVSVARELEPDTYMTDDEAVQYFCKLMNDFAHNLGMTDSNFINPDGWDEDEQYTTVSDLIKLSEYALTVPEIRVITGTFQKNVTIYSGEVFTWTNSNLLLDPYSDYYCEYAVGMKTGTTLNAGNNLIAVFQKDKRTYISIVTGCQSDTDRYELTLKLLSLAEWKG